MARGARPAMGGWATGASRGGCWESLAVCERGVTRRRVPTRTRWFGTVRRGRHGPHGQGAVFARLFFSRLEIAVDGDLRRGRVGVEVDAGEHGRIDIMFEMGDFCVVIENKISAHDQPNQLERYHKYASTRHVEDRVRLLYLTLHGSEPNNDSLGSLPLQKVKCISYESDIIGWLDACIKEVARIPQIRELLGRAADRARGRGIVVVGLVRFSSCRAV